MVTPWSNLEGRSMGPREMRDMETMKRSKRHHVSVKNCEANTDEMPFSSF